MFFCEFYETFKKSFYAEHLQPTASVLAGKENVFQESIGESAKEYTPFHRFSNGNT